jgi:hypothetical protein
LIITLIRTKMKKICISVLFAIGTQVVVAQKSFILSHIDHRGFINLSGGVSMPIQSLMKADPTATSDVTALRGSSMQVSAGYRLGRFLGVMGSVTNCLNESGTGQMLQNIQKSHFGRPTAELGTAPTQWRGLTLRFRRGCGCLTCACRGGIRGFNGLLPNSKDSILKYRFIFALLSYGQEVLRRA